MAKIQQKVYLITEQQRDALLNYLLERPYREVATGVQFLNNAPTTLVNIEVPQTESAIMPDEQESKLDTEEESEMERVSSITEEFAALSRV